MFLGDKLELGDIIVLDGATGTEISRLGGRMNSAAWCAVANKTHPHIVRQVHEEYIRAGADVVTANTFATCRHVLAGAGLADETVAINRRAVELAREARDNVGPSRPVAVAGSMSTMVAWKEGTIRPDPALLPSRDEEAGNFIEMAEALASAGADLLIMEMMLDIDRAMRCVEAAVSTGLPVWVGISCMARDDGSLVGWDVLSEASKRDNQVPGRPEGAPLPEIIDALVATGCDVYGIMHTSIDATGPALDCLFDRWSGPVMAYPETVHTDVPSQQAGITLTPDQFAENCLEWLGKGVQIIGGCCGTTIEHIRVLVERLPGDQGPQRKAA